MSMARIAESELIINPDGSVFHLHIKPGQLADNVLLVGDPGRVELVASFFESVQCEGRNREFVWATGTYRRSEEHTSELQSRPHLVCRLLLEKKKHCPKAT